MTTHDVPRFTLEEVAESSGIPKRRIRFYIERGLVSPALGKGRSAYYTPRHLAELEHAVARRQDGLSLGELRETRVVPLRETTTGEGWERFALHPDLELFLRSGSPAHLRELAARIMALSEEWLGDETDTRGV